MTTRRTHSRGAIEIIVGCALDSWSANREVAPETYPKREVAWSANRDVGHISIARNGKFCVGKVVS